MEFVATCQGPKFGVYRKWNSKKGTYSLQNRGDIAICSLEWLQSQGIPGPFDRNSGRKALSRWVCKLNIPYHQQLHIHGDLEDVWRYHYQRKLPRSGCNEREQSEDPDLATKALRKLAAWLHEPEPAKKSLKERLGEIMKELD